VVSEESGVEYLKKAYRKNQKIWQRLLEQIHQESD
jgi:hypothetical protein